jgi:diketogulonate reductase-like aldo/keto reductase
MRVDHEMGPDHRCAPLPRRAIPASGEELPVVGLGTWQAFDVGADAAQRQPLAEVLAALAAAASGTGSGTGPGTGLGAVVDTSPMYDRAERVLGELVREAGLRDSLFVATKVWSEGRASGRAQLADSARLLGPAPLDLVQVHNLLDLDTQLATLREGQAAGVLRYVGVTHYTASAHDEVERVLRRERVDFLQINFSPFEPEAERRLLPLCAERGVAVLVNRPLGGARQMSALATRPLPPWAAELGCRTWSQLLLGWVLAHPAVTCAIPGTRSPAHLATNLDAGRGVLPDAAQRARILAAVRG